jgi:hypothetical protein
MKGKTMTNAIACLPTFSREDIANARALARSYGELVGTRGRLEHVHLMVWHNALRPQLVAKTATGVGRGKHTGKRGGASTFILEGETKRATKQDSRNARLWAIENGIDIPSKGRISATVIQGWANAGAPVFEVREERATVYYVKRNHVTGSLYSKLHALTVYADMLPSTKPKSSDYVQAVDLPANAVPVRIVTANTLIDVSVGEDGEYVYAWVSKRDSKTVMNTLMSNLSLV